MPRLFDEIDTAELTVEYCWMSREVTADANGRPFTYMAPCSGRRMPGRSVCALPRRGAGYPLTGNR